MLVRQEGRGWGLATVPAPDSHSPAASGARVHIRAGSPVASSFYLKMQSLCHRTPQRPELLSAIRRH